MYTNQLTILLGTKMLFKLSRYRLTLIYQVDYLGKQFINKTKPPNQPLLF